MGDKLVLIKKIVLDLRNLLHNFHLKFNMLVALDNLLKDFQVKWCLSEVLKIQYQTVQALTYIQMPLINYVNMTLKRLMWFILFTTLTFQKNLNTYRHQIEQIEDKDQKIMVLIQRIEMVPIQRIVVKKAYWREKDLLIEKFRMLRFRSKKPILE